jgi:Rhomboid family
MFLHSGWEHILSNMLFLVLLGPRVEGRMGSWQYLIFYFLAGIAGSWLMYFMNPASATPGIGASGAIAGVIGAALITDPTAYVWVPPQFFVPVWLFAPIWFISEFWMAAKSAQGDMVAHWVHVGGFCTGLVTGFLIRRNPAPVSAMQISAQSADAHPGAPASPRPPIAPRTIQEGMVHQFTSHRIHKHKSLAVWIILAFSILVVIVNLNRDVFAALGDGLFTSLVLLGLWTGGEHLLAHLAAKWRGKPTQTPTVTSAS